jgi:hypothetical protein
VHGFYVVHVREALRVHHTFRRRANLDVVLARDEGGGCHGERGQEGMLVVIMVAVQQFGWQSWQK